MKFFGNAWKDIIETETGCKNYEEYAKEVTKVNNYHYQLTYSTTGNKTIDLDIQNERKDITLNSNTINITIV